MEEHEISLGLQIAIAEEANKHYESLIEKATRELDENMEKFNKFLEELKADVKRFDVD